MAPICRRCKRPLHDYTSQKKGFGPVCLKREDQQLNLFSNHASFDMWKKDNSIFVEDLCEPNRKSVTNDVHFVVESVTHFGTAEELENVFYKDSDGRWDRIVIENGKFKRFEPVQWDQPSQIRNNFV